MAATTTGVPDRNLDLLVEQLRQGKAIFSTNLGKYPTRRAQPLSTPVILRSDCDVDLVAMIAELRFKFPQECKKITSPVNNIYEYFDHYDVNIQGSTFIVKLLSMIAEQNEENAKSAQQFATQWMESHSEGFPDIDLDDENLFSAEEKEQYSYNYLKEVLELLKGFQARSAASSERTMDRGRLAVLSLAPQERTSSNRQESPASSSFESNPSNYRRAASTSRERSSFLAPPMVLRTPLMTDRAYTRRRNSARHTSAEQRLIFIPPVQYHSDTDAEAGVGLRDRLPLPSEPQLQNLHMHHSGRSMSENMSGVADMRQAFSNRSNYAPGVLEPFPAYFQSHTLGNMNVASSRTLNRHSRGQPFGQQGAPRRAQYSNVQPGWSYHAVNQYTSFPTLRVLSNSNVGSGGHNDRNVSSTHGSHAANNSDPAFPISSNASSLRPSPVLGGQALPYIPVAVPQTAPGFSADIQPYTYHGYIENMPPSSNQVFRESALSPLPMPRVRNNYQSQAYHQPSQNIANQFSQHQQPSARHDHHQSHGELQGRAQNQGSSRNNPRKSISDDARTMQPGDIDSRRSSASEHHTSRRGSSSELYGTVRDQSNVQQQPRRMSGARSGSRHSSFSQSQQPFRDQYKRSVLGAYGGYSPMGYFSAGRGSGDYSHLIHQTIEEHRSDGDRHSLANHNDVPGNENDLREVGRFGEMISDVPSASYDQGQGLIPAEQGRRMEMNSENDRSNHLSTMQSHNSSQSRNNTSHTQPLPSNLSTSAPPTSRIQYDRFQRDDRPLDPLKLYVSASTESADEIHEVFRPYGNIIEIAGPFTKQGAKPFLDGGPSPFYFLTYSQPVEANTALERLHRTTLPSGAGFLKVSFAFRKAGDMRGQQEVMFPAEPATRSAYPRNAQPLDAINSQATSRAQLTAENPQSASQGSLNQLPVPHHVQADVANTIIRQNVKKSSNMSNPSTPKKKKYNKKSKNPTPIRKEGASSVDTQSRVAEPVSQTLHTPGSRSEGKELHRGAAGAHGHVTKSDQVVASTRLIVDASNKENHKKQEEEITEMASEVLPAAAEDINNPVNYKQNFPRRDDSHIDQEQLNILDGSPSRKPRNLSSSRKTSQPQSQSSPTETFEQVISGNPAVPDLSEDQWPALQRPSPSPKESQQEPIIITKRLNYRAISSKIASEVKAEATSKTATTKKEVNNPGEGSSNAALEVTTPITTRAKSSDRSGHLDETSRTTSADHNSGDVNSRSVTFPRDNRIKVPTTPISIEASREVSSAGGYTNTDLPSHSQIERSNSWAEDSGKPDVSPPSNSNNRGSTTTKPIMNMVLDKSETPYSSRISGMYETEDNSSLAQVPEHGDRALPSDICIELENTPSIDGIVHDTATTPVPTVDVQSPLSESYDGNHENPENYSGTTTSVMFSVVDLDTNTKLPSRAKGMQKVLTIEVPSRGLPATSIHLAAPPPSKSPKISKSKQHLEEPSTSSSILVPSPAISTHMKKKTKKITPPRKTSRTSAPTKKDTKMSKSLIHGTEADTADGSSKDVTSSDPTLELEKMADRQNSNESKSEVPEATQATTVDLTVDQDEGVSDETQQDELTTVDLAQSDERAARVRSYPAPDPSNAVYVSEFRGPSIAKRKSLDFVQPRSESQPVQGRSYPAPDPSSAVYVTSRFPRMIVLERSNRVEDEKVATTPPSSPDIPSKKDRAKTKKNKKKKKSKGVAEHQSISGLQSIMPFPKPKAEPAAFPTLPLDEPSPRNSASHESSEVEVEMSDPFALFDPMLQAERIARRERRNTGVWTDAVNEKQSDVTAMMVLKNKGKSSDSEAFDKERQNYPKRKLPLVSELLQHIDNMDGNGLGLTVDTTSTDRDSSSMDSTKQDMTGNQLSTRSSINDNGSVPELTRGSSIVSSSSNIIFPDVPGYMSRPLSTILAPVNLTHDPSFDSSSLETSNLKARPPRHQLDFDSNIFDRPAVRIESPQKSPLAAEFGSGLISATFKPDIEQEEIGSEAFTPVPSQIKPIFSLDLLDIPSTMIEAPLKKMKLSGDAEPSSAASGFEQKPSTKPKAFGKHSEGMKSNDTVLGIQSLLPTELEAESQLSDKLKFATEVKSSCEMKAFQGVETSGEVQPKKELKPSGIVDTRNAVSDVENVLSVEADTKFQHLEDSKSMEEVITNEEIASEEEVKSPENLKLKDDVKPKTEVELQNKATSQILEPSNGIVDESDMVSTKSGYSIEFLKVVERLSSSADIGDVPVTEPNSPTKTAEDVEPFSAVSEASTIKATFPPLPSGSFSTTADSPPKLSEANVAAHTVATDSDEAREQRRSRNESISEWSTTSSFRRKTYSEAANIPSPTRRTRGQSMMSPADSEAEVDVKRRIKPRRGEANLWSIPPKEQRWTSAEE
ncbi:hypothetical protein MMC17_008027 [Xylographa soralifera]|nr:hypothetical protein [Xylographa soralifera]